MEFGRRSLWIATATMVATVSGFVVAANGGTEETPVEAAAPVTQPISQGEESTTDGPVRDAQGLADLGSFPSTTSTTPTTTTPATTTPPTTESAAPATTAPPTTAPPTTQAPPPPPPTTAPPPPPTTQPPAPAPTAGRDTGCESYMYNQVNANRSGSLTFDGGIQHVAVDWSSQMAGSQNLAHNPNYGSQIGAVRDFRSAGENVGRGYELGSLFQAFMNSPGHRANIENQAYTHVTIGCVKDGSGQYWVTQNFWG